jgi:hypothetical protein
MLKPYKTILKLYSENNAFITRYNYKFRNNSKQLDEDLTRIQNSSIKEYTITELDNFKSEKNGGQDFSPCWRARMGLG